MHGMQQLHVFVSGYVQGVGFRQFVKSEARKHSIHGWVRNLPDGRVEAMLQGEKKILEELLMTIKKGPFLAEVKDISVTWEEAEIQFSDFQIS